MTALAACDGTCARKRFPTGVADPVTGARVIYTALIISVALLLPVSAACRENPVERPVQLIGKDPGTGLELWQTMLGQLWIPEPGLDVIRHLQWEQPLMSLGRTR